MHNNSNDISYLLKNKKYKKAQLVLKKELKKSPSNPTTLRLMGVVVLHMNQLNLAEKFLLKSYKLDSSSVPTLLNIASLYKLIPDYEKAIHWIKKAVALEPTSLPALYNYANILKANAQYTDAEKLYFAVLKVDERHYGALLNLGHIYKNSGKISLAADYYHKLLAINPSDTNVYLALSNLKKYKFSKDEEYMIDKLLKDPIPVINKIPLYFCKTKILEDQNKYPESFNFLQKGNELKYKNIKRKPVNWTKYTEDIKKVFNSDFIKNSTTIDISDQSLKLSFV